MKVLITDYETLELINHNTGINWVQDFIGNVGALKDGQFTWNDDVDAYICDRETFEWWRDCIEEHQKLDDRICDLEQEHGVEKVQVAIGNAYLCDLVDQPTQVNEALDYAFGELKP